MAPGRSRADPAELSRFADATFDALAALRLKSDAVTVELDALAAAGGDDVPGMGTAAADLADLVTDWEHLGAFARDVANGFYWLLGEVGYHGGVVSFTDARLAVAGTVGFADRDAAVEAAEAMAARFRDLRADGYDDLTPAAVWRLLDRAERGRYDPAFAVAFSEAVGVEGYADLTAMIRTAYTRPAIHEPVPAEGLEGVEVLATMLTTALNTVGSGGSDRLDRLDRLDPGFVDALARDFDPEDGRSNTDFPLRTNTDLAVLIGFTAPPTSVAVAIANGRLTPLLRDPDIFDARPGDEGDDWGDRGGRITDYATMLARDPDASAQWLDAHPRGTTNLDLVLRREAGHDIAADGGRTLAELVENGVTHHDDALRGRLVERAIEVIGGAQDEIRNPHLPDALAHGVARNMPVIDHLVNDGWTDAHSGQDPPRSARHTHDFLVEVLRDDSASGTLAMALEDHTLDRFRELPPPLVGAETDGAFDRTVALEHVGHVQGVFVAAEGNALYDSVDDYLAHQEAKADTVNFMVGLVPMGRYAGEVVGPLNDLADVHGLSLGELLSADAAEHYGEAADLVRIMQADVDVNNHIMLAVVAHPEMADVPVRDMTDAQREELLGWIDTTGHTYDGQNHVLAAVGRAARYFDAERWD